MRYKYIVLINFLISVHQELCGMEGLGEENTSLLAILARAAATVDDADAGGGSAGAGGGGSGAPSHESLAEELPAYFPGGRTLESLSRDTRNEEIKEKALRYLAAEPLSNRHGLAYHRVSERLMIEYASIDFRIDNNTVKCLFKEEELDKALRQAQKVTHSSFPRKTITEFSTEQQKEFLAYTMEYIRNANKTHNQLIPYAEAARQLILKYKDIHLSMSRYNLAFLLKRDPLYKDEIAELENKKLKAEKCMDVLPDAPRAAVSASKVKPSEAPAGAGGGGFAAPAEGGDGEGGASASEATAAPLPALEDLLVFLSDPSHQDQGKVLGALSQLDARLSSNKAVASTSTGGEGGASASAASASASLEYTGLEAHQAFLSSLSPDLQTVVYGFLTNPRLNKRIAAHLKIIGKAKLEALQPLLTLDMVEHHYSIISTFGSVPEELMNDAVSHVQKQFSVKKHLSTIQDALAEFLAENASGSRKRARGDK